MGQNSTKPAQKSLTVTQKEQPHGLTTTDGQPNIHSLMPKPVVEGMQKRLASVPQCVPHLLEARASMNKAAMSIGSGTSSDIWVEEDSFKSVLVVKNSLANILTPWKPASKAAVIGEVT